MYLFPYTYQWKLVKQVFQAKYPFNNYMSPIRKCLIHKPFYKLTITSIFPQTTLIFQFTLISVPSESIFTFWQNRQKNVHTKTYRFNSNFIFHILVKFPFPIYVCFFDYFWNIALMSKSMILEIRFDARIP